MHDHLVLFSDGVTSSDVLVCVEAYRFSSWFVVVLLSFGFFSRLFVLLFFLRSSLHLRSIFAPSFD